MSDAPVPGPPRIPPGGRDEIGRVRWVAMQLLAKRLGADVPNVMLVLARHGRLFTPWLWFASRLMPKGTLPAVDTELVILRVGHRCGCAYERAQHGPIGRAAGLGQAIVDWTADDADAGLAPPAGEGIDVARAALLVRAADELVDGHDLSDATWAELSALYDERRLIELCMLVGQYAMLAGTINAARVPIDDKLGAARLR